MTAYTVKLKRSANAGGIPTTSDLALGELAVNTTDGKLFTKKSVNGTESIVTLGGSVWDASGTNIFATGKDLGLGVTSPLSVFHIKDDAARILFHNDNTGAAASNGLLLGLGASHDATAYLMQQNDDHLHIGTNNLTRIYVKNSGNIGIGTTSPASLLSVDKGIVTNRGQWSDCGMALHNPTNIGAYSQIGFGYTPSQTYASAYIGYLSTNQGASGYGDIVFGTRSVNTDSQPTERMRIDSAGRLLVGPTSSRAMYGSVHNRVQIEGNSHANSSLSLTRTGGAAPQINLASSANTSFGLPSNGGDLGIIAFMGADGSAMRNAAAIYAEVDGTPGSNDMPGRLAFSTNGGAPDTSPTERMRITQTGRVATYSTDGTANIITSSKAAGTTNRILSLRHSSNSVNGGTECLLVYTNGNVQNTNDSYGAISDNKLKENIVDAGSQWDDFKAVRFRKYNFKEETGYETHTQLGVIAQELELTSPGLVYETPDLDEEGNDLGTTTKGVKSSILTKKALVALQEAMERIETLEASNADLLARVSVLEQG